MNLLIFLFILICLGVIITLPIELKSFSEILLEKGSSEYFYRYSNSFLSNNSIPYIYIKLADYTKINLNIFINNEETYIISAEEDKWISIPLTNEKNNSNITLNIDTKKRNLTMIFIDSSKILNISLLKLLNLKFTTNILFKKPFPLEFNILVDKNISFSIQEKENYYNFDGTSLLSFCILTKMVFVYLKKQKMLI